MIDERYQLLRLFIIQGDDLAAQQLIDQIRNLDDVLQELLERPSILPSPTPAIPTKTLTLPTFHAEKHRILPLPIIQIPHLPPTPTPNLQAIIPLQPVETPGVTTTDPSIPPTLSTDENPVTPPIFPFQPTETPHASILPLLTFTADSGTPFNLVKAQEWLQNPQAQRPPPEPPPSQQYTQTTISFFHLSLLCFTFNSLASSLNHGLARLACRSVLEVSLPSSSVGPKFPPLGTTTRTK